MKEVRPQNVTCEDNLLMSNVQKMEIESRFKVVTSHWWGGWGKYWGGFLIGW